MADLRVGLIGAGWIGRTHAATLARLDGVQLVAAADPVATGVQYRDGRALLATESLHAVLVCTPPDLHRDAAVAAAERGVAVYLEKPVAHTAADADAIAAALGDAQLVCAVGYQYRALDLLDGLRGPFALLAGTGVSPAMRRPWLGDAKRGGGVVLERASHLIDLQRALAGEVATVAGAEAPGALALLLRFTGGALGTVTVCDAPGAGWSMALTRRDGGAVELALDPEFRLRDRGVVRRHAGPPPLERSLLAFLEAVRSGDPSRVSCPLAEGVATLRVALAGQLAAQDGIVVAVASRNASSSSASAGATDGGGATPRADSASDSPGRPPTTTSV